MNETILLVAAFAIGVPILLCTLALVVIAVLAYRIAVLYSPQDTARRPVPAFGRPPTEPPLSSFDADTPPVEGRNGYPMKEVSVAEPEESIQLGVRESALASDRQQWWEEMRGEGYDDDEIAEIERSGVVPLFGE